MHEQLARILEIVMRLEENSPRSSLAEVSGALAARLPSDLQNKPRDVDAIHRMTGMKMSELTEAHVLWSYEKVVERYGSPTRIGPSSHPLGIRFYYETDSGEALMFHFIEGVVAGVIWD